MTTIHGITDNLRYLITDKVKRKQVRKWFPEQIMLGIVDELHLQNFTYNMVDEHF